MMGSGGMVVLDESDCMVNIAKFFLQFTKDESCGKCTPCRVGTKRLLEILERITEGKGEPGDIDLLQDLADCVGFPLPFADAFEAPHDRPHLVVQKRA